MPEPFGEATNFSLVSFSNGQVIGSGQAFQTALEPIATPEPASLGLLTAVAVIAFVRRRTA